ncbi:MAG: type II secretion system F family protein [Hyphomicrobiaceae bacterium]|nr:type II secretion system F family protein [Hyphomicrobiaceae bacterium]
MLDILLVIALSALICGCLFVLVSPSLAREDVNDRIQSATTSRTKKVAARSAADVTNSRKKAVAETLKELDNRKKKVEKKSLRARLQQAGLEAQPYHYWCFSVGCAIACAFAVYVSLPAAIATMAIPLSLVAGFADGLGLPNWFLNYMIKSRQKKFLGSLANALDVVVRGIKTGLPVNECLGIIARESPEPLASEFREVVDQQRVGVTLGEALDRLVIRMPLPEVKFLAIVISIQQAAGGNLSEALGNLSQVLRDRQSLKLKVKALSAEALASAAVLGCLPPGVILMIYLSTPNYLKPLWETTTGNFLIGIGMVLMAIGIFVMNKMINFKY